jgi:hypothetical protein
MLLFGPLAIISMVLVVAGVWKVRRPAPTRDALRAMHVPVPLTAVRGLGLLEVALAVATIAAGGVVLPALVGGLYLVFAVVSWQLRDADISCGCFGAASATPPGPLHIGVNLVAAAVALAVALTDGPTLRDAWGDLPGAGIPHVMLVLIGTAATVGVLTVLPDARASAKGAPTRRHPVLFQPTRRAVRTDEA